MSETVPTPEELGMHRFEVLLRSAKGGGLEKVIYIDGEMLDWQVDLNSYVEAVKMGPAFMVEAQKSIAEHFVEAVSDTLGRKVTIGEIKTATKTGWI